MKKITFIVAALIILSSCGPKRMGCGPRRCAIEKKSTDAVAYHERTTNKKAFN